MLKIRISVSADIRFDFEGAVNLEQLQTLIDQWTALIPNEAALAVAVANLKTEAEQQRAAVAANS